jgi:hypothetical protein
MKSVGNIGADENIILKLLLYEVSDGVDWIHLALDTDW